MNNHLVSIIVPVFNAENYISRCIESLISQTYNNLQIIIVDDASTDSTLKICKSFVNESEEIVLLKQPMNMGQSAARNLGLAKASGEFLMFVDSDDWLPDQAVEIAVRCSIRDDADLVCFDFLPIGPYGPTERRTVVANSFPEMQTSSGIECLKQIYTRHLNSYVWIFLYKSDLLSTYDIRFDDNVSFLEDFLFLNRILSPAKKVVYYNSRPLYNYSLRANSATHASNTKNAKEGFESIKKVIKYSEKKLIGEISFTDYIISLLFFVDLTLGKARSVDDRLLRRAIYKQIREISAGVDFFQLSRNIQIKLVLLKIGIYGVAKRVKRVVDFLKSRLFQGRFGYGAFI